MFKVQKEITDFFKSSRNMESKSKNLNKKKLSLKREKCITDSPVPTKVSRIARDQIEILSDNEIENYMTNYIIDPESVSVNISSSEETVTFTQTETKIIETIDLCMDNSQENKRYRSLSGSSDGTIIVTPEKNPEVLDVFINKVVTNSQTPCCSKNLFITNKINKSETTNSDHKNATESFLKSPKSIPSTPKTKKSNQKFYSPTRKKVVKSPNKRNNATRVLFSDHSETKENDLHFMYKKACFEQDYKTVAFLDMILNCITNIISLFESQEVEMLTNVLRLSKSSIELVDRLYWCKERWYRSVELMKKIDHKDVMFDMELCNQGYLDIGTKANMELEDYGQILNSNEISQICKYLKIKNGKKKESFESLRLFSRKKSIGNYFGSQVRTNQDILFNLMDEKVGTCFKISKKIRAIVYKGYLLSYLGIDFDLIRENKLNYSLLNLKRGIEEFPITSMELDSPMVIFESICYFNDYLEAHLMYEAYLKSDNKVDYIERALNAYRQLKSNFKDYVFKLPAWLRGYTSTHTYLKLLDEGIVELKKLKQHDMSVEILDTLIQQETFKTSKRGEWYDIKALIQHRCMKQHQQAATTLLDAFKSDLNRDCKCIMSNRAKQIAKQQNIKLDESVRDLLMLQYTLHCVTQENIPSVTFYKPSMDNTGVKGKSRFKMKENGVTGVITVEEYAIKRYLEDSIYTNGKHWEGQIITTIYLLLFWDIIYTSKKLKGIYLSRLQRYPMDMFSKCFYDNRKSEIDNRLEWIMKCTDYALIEFMENIIAGLSDAIKNSMSLDNILFQYICEIVSCLGAKGVHTICGRLACNYAYTRSGFPDLTLWNPTTKLIKFVEVKSDNDTASLKQIKWMQHLLDNDIDCEFCYVGVKQRQTYVGSNVESITCSPDL